MPGTHNVYVIELGPEVLKSKRVLKLNPNYDPAKPPLYIGMTGLPVEDRFKKHKAGIKANLWVNKHGLKLRPELYKDFHNLEFHRAEQTEEQLAKKLRAQGYPILGGNKQLPGRQLKKSAGLVDPHKAGLGGSKWLNGFIEDGIKFPGSLTHDDFKKKYPHWVKQADWTAYDKKREMNEPLPVQQARVVKRIQDPNTPGLVLFHGMGSGKTRASIESYKALKMPADVLVPAALKDNFKSELKKWIGRVPGDVNIQSQQRFANSALKTPLYGNGLQIVDEAQKASDNHTELYQRLAATHPKKRLLLSGTPMPNNPAELANLINLAASKQVLPDNITDFRKQYFKQEEVSPGLLGKLTGVKPGLQFKLQNKPQLKAILNKYVDYYKPTSEGYPSVTEQDVKVPMGKNQQDIYNSILGNASWYTRYKVKHNIPPGRGELAGMKAFLSGPRQVSNSTSGFTTKLNDVESPKINAAFKFLQSEIAKDPKYKAIIYSNYLNNGIKPYERLLQKNHVNYGEFSGAISPSQRVQNVKDYNANKLNALLISGAGAEGLNTTETRLEQLLDPHWNLAKERQVIARGVRFHSHDTLPPEKRNVLVQRYFAQPKPSMFDRLSFNPHPTGTDEYIHNIAKQKDQMNQEVVNLIAPKEQRWWSGFSEA